MYKHSITERNKQKKEKQEKHIFIQKLGIGQIEKLLNGLISSWIFREIYQLHGNKYNITTEPHLQYTQFNYTISFSHFSFQLRQLSKCFKFH